MKKTKRFCFSVQNIFWSLLFLTCFVSSGFSKVSIDIEHEGLETFRGEVSREPLIVSVTENGKPLENYHIVINNPSPKKLGVHLKDSSLITDASGKANIYFRGGRESGDVALFLDITDPDGKFVTTKTAKILNINIPGIILTFLGALSIFLFGLKIMSNGLQSMNANSLKKFFSILEKNSVVGPILGIFLGTIVTAIIQSSSATTVMVVGLINSGIMTLHQSVGIIMGANIGTTVTAQLVSLKLTDIALPMIALGFILTICFKSKKWHFLGESIIGFGLLFLGMKIMSDLLKPLATSATITDYFVQFSQHPLLGILAGTVFTVLFQSSSATTAVIISLASSGLIDILGTFPLILGANIGTTVTAQLAALSAVNVAAKQAAWIHTLFNTIGVLIIFLLIELFKDKNGIPYVYDILGWLNHTTFYEDTSHRLWLATGNMGRFAANSHLIFNLFNTLLFLPFTGLLCKAAEFIVPDKNKKENRISPLESHLQDTPLLAVRQAHQAVHHMLVESREIVKLAIEALKTMDLSQADVIETKEELVNNMHYRVSEYIIETSSKKTLDETETKAINYVIREADIVESIGDMGEKLLTIAKSLKNRHLKFGVNKIERLSKIEQKIDSSIELTISLLEESNTNTIHETVARIKAIEIDINEYYQNLHHHYTEEFLSDCDKNNVALGILFQEILGCIEKIGDYTRRITDYYEEDMT